MVIRKAMVIRVRPEKLAEYRALHAKPFPGVIAALKAANVSNYSIFLKDDLLFGYLEYSGSDWAADMAKVAADPETQRWWQLTDPCQTPLESAAPGEWWADMEPLFYMA
ncbi:L-rhamnose mutarotase [Sandaracinobacteroides saxicola]|uniref:L-rhamnose mutarotase n=1 Tax=Sandaracinobacteroides saxicola TaxID=2759707 RepID=A0A7G5ILG8_9SPHN|nr:L-rhamnose mutarotase [Sandaracinobacteroides saxicola]QMW24210.1 L-rhamnose mutarotase [Sandaracinobacteroides saxicola]